MILYTSNSNLRIIKIYRISRSKPKEQNTQFHLEETPIPGIIFFPYHHGTWNRSISTQIISLLIIGLARNLIRPGWIDRFHQLFIDNALRNTHQLEFYDRFYQDTSKYAHQSKSFREIPDKGLFEPLANSNLLSTRKTGYQEFDWRVLFTREGVQGGWYFFLEPLDRAGRLLMAAIWTAHMR